MFGNGVRQIGRRNDIGHVCLSCRHRIRTAAAQHAQARWQTTVHHQQGASEDWANNFNDLSVTAPKTAPKPEKSAKAPMRILVDSRQVQVQGKAASINSQTNPSSPKPNSVVRRQVSRSDRVEAPRRVRAPKGSDAAESPDLTTERRKSRPGSTRRRRIARREARLLLATGKQKEEASDTLDASSVAADLERDRVEQLEQMRQTASAKAVEQAHHENDEPLANPFVGAATSSSVPGESVWRLTRNGPSPPYDDVEVPLGKVSSLLAKQSPSHLTLTSISERSRSPPPFASDREIVPMSISDRIDIKRDAPGWTLSGTSRQSASGPGLGFFALRDKDKVSPVPPPPATAVNSRPYGVEPPSTRESKSGNAGMANSDLAEDSVTGSAAQSTIQPDELGKQPRSSISDHLSKGMQSIRGAWNNMVAPTGVTEPQRKAEAEVNTTTVPDNTHQEAQIRVKKIATIPYSDKGRDPFTHATLCEIEQQEGSVVDPKDIADYKKLQQTIKTQAGIPKRRNEKKLRILANKIWLDYHSIQVKGQDVEDVKTSSESTSSNSLKKDMVLSEAPAVSHTERASSAEATSKGKGQQPAPVSEVETFVKKQSSRKSAPAGENSLKTPNELQPPVASPDSAASVVYVDAKQLKITPLDIPQPPVPRLAYGLDRVLFNPGVYQLQDPLSRVFNFDPYLQKIMPVTEFDFTRLGVYKTSSKDMALAEIAKEQRKKYIGSTSSMTYTLGHFHYLLSGFRPLNLDMLSRGFPGKKDDFTAINRAPNSIFLRRKENGLYAIDADKEYDGSNVLMMLGKSMEKLLTMPKDDYERYRKSDPRTVPDEEKNAAEAYEYTTMGDFLMRSQLDAQDPRLPGTGTFDLKTRAVVSVRHDARDFEPMTGYEIQTLQGHWESYEREFYDLMRSTMLKYSLQARMGRMDGIFIAHHNVERIFGFQYLSMQDMDRALHGQIDPCLGDQEFKVSVKMLNDVLNKATAKFPDTSLRLHFETKPKTTNEPFVAMYIFAEPMEEEEIDKIQNMHQATEAEFEKTMMGIERKEEGETKPALNGSEESTVAISAQESITPPADLTSSASAADTAFFDTIKDGEIPKKPLFAATLICVSKVNGEAVSPRPERLKPEDEWTVQYMLKEMPDPAIAWSWYEGTKARRKQEFGERSKEAVVNDDGEVVENSYIKVLKQFSQRGRDFRAKLEKYEAQKEAVVFEPLDKSTAS